MTRRPVTSEIGSATSGRAVQSALASNLADYADSRRNFSWAAAQQLLSGLPDGDGLNIAYEAVDRHVATGRGGHVAIRSIGRPVPAN